MPRGATESVLTRAGWTAYVALNVLPQAWFPRRSPAAVERAQKRRLRRTVAHAYEHVPYYRETMDRLGLAPASFEGVADLARLPLLRRAQLQRDPEYFVSAAQPIERYVPLRSGGSSGAPLTIFYDPFTLFQGASHHQRHLAAVRAVIGRRMRLRQAFLEAPSGVSAGIADAVGSRSVVPVRLRTVSRRLSAHDTPARNVELLNEFRPDTLRAFGSYLEGLFVHLRECGTPFVRPKVVI